VSDPFSNPPNPNNPQPNPQNPQDPNPYNPVPHPTDPIAPRVFQNVSNRITQVAGVDQLEGFSIKELFSQVFKKHSEDEIEEYFTVGTARTTPAIQEVDTTWPKPWMFFRTIVGALFVYGGFVFAWKEFQNSNLIPGLILVGSFAIPTATLIFFFEVNVRKNISLYQVIRLLFFGGILSLIFSLVLFRLSNFIAAFNPTLSWLGASIAGLVEEPGKLLALMLVINLPKYKYIHNGLLFGAAVGTGFAAFESAGYALVAGLGSVEDMLQIITLRGMLSPFAHIVWTGMNGAALWKVKEDRPFSMAMLQDLRFVRVFVISIILHMIWNSGFELPFFGKQLILGFIAWVVILGFLQDGLKQLRGEKLLVLSNPQ
jgi:RsiW-degrading membrane proteinase PrsW (M82 family)